MAEKIPDEQRAAIEAAVRKGAGKVSCRGVAREFGVSPGTVRNIAKAAGLAGAFARAGTENATRARTADLASRRAGLAEQMLDMADHLLKRARSPYEMYVNGGMDGARRVELDEPPLSEVRQAMTAIGIALDKHIALIRFDTKDGGNAAALSLVDALASQLNLDGAGQGNDADDGYPVPLPSPEQIAEGAALLDADTAAAAAGTSSAGGGTPAVSGAAPAASTPPSSPAAGGAGGDLG